MELNSDQWLHTAAPASSAGEAPVAADAPPQFDVRFGYRIGSHRFVLEKTLLTEIVMHPTIYEIPKGPPWLRGVINLRGNILAVIDLSEALGTVCKSNPGEFVLVIDKGSEALALVVDAAPRSLVNPVPARQANDQQNLLGEFVQAGVQSENNTWMQLDAKRLARSLRAQTDTHV